MQIEIVIMRLIQMLNVEGKSQIPNPKSTKHKTPVELRALAFWFFFMSRMSRTIVTHDPRKEKTTTARHRTPQLTAFVSLLRVDRAILELTYMVPFSSLFIPYPNR